ncbi:MAG TPA: hypothetical protein P5026_12315 [Kiritimatiellia bacterium]|nr:hypothetical protein [Kiritimatiellia bacterium]HRU71166.1 hypothetical protein [Kiritimatiellia bacterium]
MEFDTIRDEDLDEVTEGQKGCLRGLVNLFLFLLVPLAVVVVLIPTLLSMDGGRRWVLGKVNAAAAPMHVSFERWSLGWFRAPVLETFSFSDPQRGISLTAERVAFDRGLLRLLPVGVLDLGEVTLNAPVFDLDLAPVPKPEEKGAKTGEGKKGFLFLPVVDVAIALNVTGGRASVHGGGAGRCMTEQVEGRVTLTSYRKPISVQTRMQVGGGLLALEGRVQSIRDLYKGADWEQPESMTFKAVGVDLTAFAPLIEFATGDAWIRSGTAEGALTVTVHGPAQGKISGGMAVNRLSVGARDEKPSPPGDMALMVDIGVDGKTFTITQFNLASPWMRAEAKGTLHGAEEKGKVTGMIDGKATVQLAPLVRDFGSALGLSKDFTMSGGELRASLLIEGNDTALQMQAGVVAADLAMQAGTQSITFKPEPALQVKARFPYGTWPEVDRLHLKVPFADVYASGRFDAATLKAQIDLTRFGRDATRIFKVCPPMVGSIYLDASSRRDGAGVALASFLKLSDVAVEVRPDQRMVVPQGTLKAAGRMPLQGDEPQAEVHDVTFELTLENGRASGACRRLVPAGEGRPLQVSGFSLSSDMEVASVRRLLGGILPVTVQRRLSAWQGRVAANATAEAAGGAVKARLHAAGLALTARVEDGVWRVPDVRVEGSVTRDHTVRGTALALAAHGEARLERDGEVVFAEPAARMTVEAAVAEDGAGVAVSKLDVTSSLFTMESQAALSELSGRCLASAKGRAALDAGAVTRLLAAKGIDELTLTGREFRPFRFSSPLAGGLSTVLAEGELDAAAHVKSLAGLGLRAGPADVLFRLSKGVLRIGYEPVLNGGRLRLVPEMAVGGRGGGVLTVPPKTRMLERVALTQEMVDTLLVNLNPLFQGSRVRDGTVSLDVRNCRVEPGVVPEHGNAADLDITFENLKLELGPSLRDLFGMIKVKTRVYEVARLPLHVTVRNGRIQADPVRLVIENQPVIIGGWVAFNGAVNYVIEVPVTERLVGSAAFRMLRGTSIKIPVSGTVDEPRLDTRALQNMLSSVLKNAVGEQAVERVSGFLEKLRQELSK